MRIARLALLRYGCFTDATLDFGAPGLHVVVGPNEAGKSTSRAAVADLLFGFPVRTPQAHIHSTSDLCLGATIAMDEGEISFERHKRKPYVRAADGALADDALTAGSINRELYEALFAMGHEELREGAAELLRTRGNIGRILFGVTAGRAGAAALLDRLQAEAEELFKPRSQKRGLMAALGAHADARERMSAAALPPATWSRAAEELRQLEEAIAAQQDERARHTMELASLKTLRAALPLLARREEALDKRGAVTGVTVASAVRSRVTAALEQLAEAQATAATAQAELARATAAAPTPASDGVLVVEEQVVALQEQLGAFRQALIDLPQMEARAAVAEAAVTAASARCGLGVDAAPTALPPAAVQAEALLVASELEEERRRVSAAGAERQQAEAALREAQARFDEAAVPPATAPARHALAAVTLRLAHSERLREAAARAVAAAKEQERARDALAASTTVPTSAELLAAREARDDQWQEVRVAWSGGIAFDPATADAFKRRIADADVLADRRHAEAEATGRLAAAEEALTQAEADRVNAIAAAHAAAAEVDHLTQHLAAEVERIAGVAISEVTPEAAIRAAETALDAAAATETLHSRLSTTLNEARVDLGRAIEVELAAAAAHEEVTHRWSAACGALGLPAHLSPVAVRAHLEALRDLGAAQADAVQANADAEALRSRIGAFEAAAAATASAVSPPPVGTTAEDIAAELIRRLRPAIEARAAAAVAQMRIAELTAEAHSAAAEREAQQAVLRELATTCGIDLDALPDVVDASLRCEELEAEIAEVDALILQTVGISAEAAAAATAARNAHRTPADVEREIAELETALADIDRDLGDMHFRRGELRKTLDQWRGADDAARSAHEMQEAAAHVAESATRYARLRIAHEILRREVDQNRERHQGPVLRRAAEHLAALTSNRYVDILDAIDDGAVLDVRRFDGEVVGVERLSEGTRDQLWLALRLAALERWCEDREPLPLVLDDVCMTFDDERTAAALQLLAKLSDRLQVLFFTHHESVAATAARVIPSGRVHVHRLERFNPPVKQADRPRPAKAPRKRSPAA